MNALSKAKAMTNQETFNRKPRKLVACMWRGNIAVS